MYLHSTRHLSWMWDLCWQEDLCTLRDGESACLWIRIWNTGVRGFQLLNLNSFWVLHPWLWGPSQRGQCLVLISSSCLATILGAENIQEQVFSLSSSSSPLRFIEGGSVKYIRPSSPSRGAAADSCFSLFLLPLMKTEWDSVRDI